MWILVVDWRRILSHMKLSVQVQSGRLYTCYIIHISLSRPLSSHQLIIGRLLFQPNRSVPPQSSSSQLHRCCQTLNLFSPLLLSAVSHQSPLLSTSIQILSISSSYDHRQCLDFIRGLSHAIRRPSPVF